MSHAALGPAVNKGGEALARPLIRAQDFHGSCQRKSDTGPAGRFHYHQGTAPEYPIIGNPDPDALSGRDMF